MNILLKKKYGKRKAGEIIAVTNDKGKELIEEGIGTLTKLPDHDAKKPAKPKAKATPKAAAGQKETNNPFK